MEKQQETSVHSTDEKHNTGSRRRGKVLEDAILQATWHELSEVGYNQITMEGIAERAKTSKSVLYRRWPNKSELVIAALRKYLPKLPNEIPNTGNLRDDVLSYLLGLAKPLQKIEAQTIRALMEYFGSKLIASMPQIIHLRSKSKLTADMTTILKNAELRGEISLDNLTIRIISLPLDLLRYEILTRQAPISDKKIEEIVDDIFLPLVYAKQQ